MSIVGYKQADNNPFLLEAHDLETRSVHDSQCTRIINILPQVIARGVAICKALESRYKLLSESVIIRIDLGVEFHPLGEANADSDEPVYCTQVHSSQSDSNFSYASQFNLPDMQKVAVQDNKLKILERDNLAARQTIKSSLTGLWKETLSPADVPHSILAGGNATMVLISSNTVQATDLSQEQVFVTLMGAPQTRQQAHKDWYRIFLNEVTTSIDINWFSNVSIYIYVCVEIHSKLYINEITHNVDH